MLKTWMVLAALAVGAGAAHAAPLKVRNGSSVRVALAGKREMGVGLRPHGHGWELLLSTSAPTPVGAVADVFDVTEGAGSAKWTVEVSDNALFLDDETFIAGHAYRVIVRRGTESLGTALVYLYPPSVASRHKVTFDDVDTAPASDEGIPIMKKPTL
jgi:hypothetical protein